MAGIKLEDFLGLQPRWGEQHLSAMAAVDTQNVDLDSGELRPLLKPALVKTFPRPGDPDFLYPPADNFEGGFQLGEGGNGFPPGIACEAVAVSETTFSYESSDITAPITASVTVTAGTAPVTYEWFINGTQVPGQVDSSFSYPWTWFSDPPYNIPVEWLASGGAQAFLDCIVRNPCGEVWVTGEIRLTPP